MATMHAVQLETLRDVKAVAGRASSASRRSLQAAVDFARAEAEAEVAAARPPAHAPGGDAEAAVVERVHALVAKNDSLARYVAQLSSTFHHVCYALSLGGLERPRGGG